MTIVTHDISGGKIDIDITGGTYVYVYTQPPSSGGGGLACDDLGDCIHAYDAKVALVDADEFVISDSEDTNLPKKTLWSSIKSVLKTYFDTLYATVAQLAGYLKLDQSTAQEITGGFPYYEDTHAPFTDQHQLVDKEYVDSALAQIGARFFMLDAADLTVAAYKQTSMTPSALATANVSASINASADTLIEEWISPSTMTFSSLAAGVYDLNIFAAKTAGNRVVRIFWRFYERLADTSEVMIAQSNLSEIVTTYARFRVYATLTTDYTPTAGSRLVGKVYMQTTSGSQNTTTVLYYQGDEDSHWQTPVSLSFLNETYIKGDGVRKATVSSTQPSDPTTGDLWVDTS